MTAFIQNGTHGLPLTRGITLTNYLSEQEIVDIFFCYVDNSSYNYVRWLMGKWKDVFCEKTIDSPNTREGRTITTTR